MSTPQERAELAAFLRHVADLVEKDETIPLPYTSAHFIVTSGPDPVAVMAATAQALDLPWQGSVSRGNGPERYGLNACLVGGIVRVSVAARADLVCEEAGTTTVTVPGWKPAPAIAALLSGTEGAVA